MTICSTPILPPCAPLPFQHDFTPHVPQIPADQREQVCAARSGGRGQKHPALCLRQRAEAQGDPRRSVKNTASEQGRASEQGIARIPSAKAGEIFLGQIDPCAAGTVLRGLQPQRPPSPVFPALPRIAAAGPIRLRRTGTAQRARPPAQPPGRAWAHPVPALPYWEDRKPPPETRQRGEPPTGRQPAVQGTTTTPYPATDAGACCGTDPETPEMPGPRPASAPAPARPHAAATAHPCPPAQADSHQGAEPRPPGRPRRGPPPRGCCPKPGRPSPYGLSMPQESHSPARRRNATARTESATGHRRLDQRKRAGSQRPSVPRPLTVTGFQHKLRKRVDSGVQPEEHVEDLREQERAASGEGVLVERERQPGSPRRTARSGTQGANERLGDTTRSRRRSDAAQKRRAEARTGGAAHAGHCQHPARSKKAGGG